MAKYRLIQTYPGQNKLGVIASPTDFLEHDYVTENGDWFLADTIENNPQYWEKVVELEFDWSCLPAWANNYIAMDEGRMWFSYNKRPIVVGNVYSCSQGYTARIPTGYSPKNFTEDWKKSRIRNPNK